MTGDLGNISQGLGRFTPEVWSRLGRTIRETEREQDSPIRDLLGTVDQGVQIFAKIKKAVLIQNLSGEPSDKCTPKRVFRYSFEQVGLKFNLQTGPELVTMEGAIKTEEESSEGAGDGNNLFAFNLAEFLQPSTRTQSIGGVMLKENNYPDLTTVPTIHQGQTNIAGVTETVVNGSGPVVVMNLVDLVVPEVDTETDPNAQADPNDIGIAGFFYSAINLDGTCEAECDGEDP